jgi:hypothetical protein
MHVQIGSHTLTRAEERGTSEAEIVDVLTTGFSIPAKYGKMGKAKVYEFARSRHGKYYRQKRVEVFYVRDGDDLITVTVYVFFGTWGGSNANSL